jgi:hypothetical protein
LACTGLQDCLIPDVWSLNWPFFNIATCNIRKCFTLLFRFLHRSLLILHMNGHSLAVCLLCVMTRLQSHRLGYIPRNSIAAYPWWELCYRTEWTSTYSA